ncbi:MAG: SCO family protein [Rudaea sp.]
MDSAPRPARSIPVAYILIAAFAAALGLWFGQRVMKAPSPPSLHNAVLYPSPRAVPDFHLTQANGKPLTLGNWRGHWNVVYIGYVSCPDVCPTTLATFKSVWHEMQERKLAANFQFDFISVDPQRDTPELLAKYVAFFSPDFIAATGSDEELERVARSLGLLYSRSIDAKGNIEVDHSGSAVIIDPNGQLVGMFRPPFSASDMLTDLTTLVAAH